MDARLNEQADPFLGFAKNQRGTLPGKDLIAQHFAANHRPEDLRQKHRLRIETGDDLQLGQSLLPAAQDAIQLEEENAQPRVSRIFSDFSVKCV